MSFYLDTSILVAALTRESATERVQHWLGQQSVEYDLVISDWVVTEFSSALSLKLRTGQLGEAQRASALLAFNDLATRSLRVVPIERQRFRDAAQLTDTPNIALRAADALHLACAAGLAAELVTLDRRMAEAGLSLGIPTLLL